MITSMNTCCLGRCLPGVPYVGALEYREHRNLKPVFQKRPLIRCGFRLQEHRGHRHKNAVFLTQTRERRDSATFLTREHREHRKNRDAVKF